MASSLTSQVESIQITEAILNSLDYDSTSTPPPKEKINRTSSMPNKPSVFFVFHQSDLNAAAYHIAKSLEHPLNPLIVQSIYVQESCAPRFTNILRTNLRHYTDEITSNSTLMSALERVTTVATQLNAKIITPHCSGVRSPIVVHDIPREHFVDDDNKIVPVVSLFTFRTVKEAIALSRRENPVDVASIWSENHALAYEVVGATLMKEYYINCYNIAWDPIADYIDGSEPYVTVENSYHYETLLMSGKKKAIVFPFGTIFAN